MNTPNRPLTPSEQHLIALIDSLEEAVQRSLEAPGYETFNYWACESNDINRKIARCIQQIAGARFAKSLDAA